MFWWDPPEGKNNFLKHWDIHCMFSKSSHGFGTRCLDLDCLGWFLMAGWWSWGVNSQFFHHGLNGRTRLNQSVAWFFLRGRKNAAETAGIPDSMQSRNMGRLNLLLQWRSCLPSNSSWWKPTMNQANSQPIRLPLQLEMLLQQQNHLVELHHSWSLVPIASGQVGNLLSRWVVIWYIEAPGRRKNDLRP